MTCRARPRAAWTATEAIEAIKAFHARHGYQPISSEAGPLHGLPTWASASRLFGSWNALIEAAGFRPYPAHSSMSAKTMAYRDRNPDWRERLMRGVKVTHA